MTEARRSTSSKQCACLEGTIQLTDAGVGPKTSHRHIPDGQRMRCPAGDALGRHVQLHGILHSACTGRWAAGACRSRNHWA